MNEEEKIENIIYTVEASREFLKNVDHEIPSISKEKYACAVIYKIKKF